MKIRFSALLENTYLTEGRKDSTAASNINELLSLFYINHKYLKYAKLLTFLAKTPSADSGILKGNNTKITYQDILDLLEKDSTAIADSMIGNNNATAIKQDIDVKNIKTLYWTPREKPNGVNKNHPADIVIAFKDDSMLGYSNKAISTKTDETPKFNTNVHSFFLKSEDTIYANKIKQIIDDSWNEAVANSNDDVKEIMSDVNISKEPYTETGSRKLFDRLGEEFNELGLNFFKEDFYWKYRNIFIRNFIKFLSVPKNFIEFLHIIADYTFGKSGDLPYKLLIGSVKGSVIKDISNNEALKNILYLKKLSSKPTFTYDGQRQSFKIDFNYNNKKVNFTVTVRTRSNPHWAGKSLFITTPGLKIS